MTSKVFNTSFRIFVLGLQNFVRNSWLTVAATTAMVISIAFGLAGFIFNITSQNVIADLAHHLEISVYIEAEASSGEIESLRQNLVNHSAVERVQYVSAVEAKERFLVTYGDDQQARAAIELSSGEFPRSLEITAVDLNKVDQIEAVLEEELYQSIIRSHSLEKVDAQAVIQRAISIQQALVRVSLTLVLVMVGLAFLVIFNTMRMAIFARREEVQIMRLIGAPAHFIRNPHLVEAGLYGFVAGLIATVLVYSLLFAFGSTIQNVPELVESYQYFTQNIWMIFVLGAIASLAGVGVSLLSCAWALQRYLRF